VDSAYKQIFAFLHLLIWKTTFSIAWKQNKW